MLSPYQSATEKAWLFWGLIHFYTSLEIETASSLLTGARGCWILQSSKSPSTSFDASKPLQ
jgi:hypothetical protein